MHPRVCRWIQVQQIQRWTLGRRDFDPDPMFSMQFIFFQVFGFRASGRAAGDIITSTNILIQTRDPRNHFVTQATYPAHFASYAEKVRTVQQ